MNETEIDKFLSSNEVRRIVGGKSRATLWRWVREGKFPKPRELGPNSRGWLQSEVADWIASRPEA